MAYNKRTKTGDGIVKGGLQGDKYQEWSTSLLHPTLRFGEVLPMKIEVSSMVKSRIANVPIEDYFSLRFEDFTDAKIFLVSLLLAYTEYAKHSEHESEKDFLDYLRKLPEIIESGHFNSRLQFIGHSKQIGGAKQ